jgi:hypothetical protein
MTLTASKNPPTPATSTSFKDQHSSGRHIAAASQLRRPSQRLAPFSCQSSIKLSDDLLIASVVLLPSVTPLMATPNFDSAGYLGEVKAAAVEEEDEDDLDEEEDDLDDDDELDEDDADEEDEDDELDDDLDDDDLDDEEDVDEDEEE